MLSITQCLALASQLQAISDSARLDCEVLLAYVLDKQRVYLYTWPEKELTQQQETQFLACLERRKHGEPVAHILGEKEFWSLSLRVNSSTLIPRPETELLVEIVLELFATDTQAQAKKMVADLGTGTGAIALAIASERPHWSVWGYEKYEQALILARDNCARLGFANVQLQQSDWFSDVGEQVFDMIVANPPYIDSDDVHLQQGDVRFEPRSALVADAQGLSDLSQIIQASPEYLHAGGYVLLEHGYQQACDVQAILHRHHFIGVETYKDLSGQPRVTIGRKPL